VSCFNFRYSVATPMPSCSAALARLPRRREARPQCTRVRPLQASEGRPAPDRWEAPHQLPAADRKDFGLTWNQALETGGVMVGDRVDIEAEIEAVQQVEAQVA
jgi:hypothetical protein